MINSPRLRSKLKFYSPFMTSTLDISRTILDSSQEAIVRIANIEKRADRCLQDFALGAAPLDKASWTILSAVVHQLEDSSQKFGPDSTAHRAAMINLARHAPMLIRWLGDYNVAATPDPWIPRWDSFMGGQSFRDLRVVANYDGFLSTFPMWHRNRLRATLLSDDVVRFQTHPDSRDRQVSAFQKGMRNHSHRQVVRMTPRVEPTEAILRRYQRILEAARPVGARGFHYDHPEELASRTLRKYIPRWQQIMRRNEDLSLGPYTLGTFKNFYAALQSLCAIHDFLCYQWGLRSGLYPIESAVLVKERSDWIGLISFHSGVNRSTTEQILDDLTFHSKRLPDLHVFPFVPLDRKRQKLALVPQFILGASPEDNILRTCSYLREGPYSRLSDDKAATMRDDLLETLKRFECHHSIPLPDGATDIDLLVEDPQSSTVLIAELKWYRKSSTYRERLRADADFEDGYRRQLTVTQEYCREHPEWLRDRGDLKHALTDYKNVFFLLIGRDHWTWFEPEGNKAVVECEQFRLAVDRQPSLDEAIRDVLRYDWLPIEGVDFHVQYDRGVVEDVGVESEVYYGGPPLRRS